MGRTARWNRGNLPPDAIHSPASVASFVEYVDEKQFTPEAIRLAYLAKDEVLKLRSKLVSIHDAARYLPGKAARDDSAWTKLSAAIALGYLGKTFRARWLFKSIERKKPVHDWEVRLREIARGFAETLDRSDDFQRYVKETIWKTRKLLKLPERTELDIDREDSPVLHRWKSRFTVWRADLCGYALTLIDLRQQPAHYEPIMS